jgi:hypothetical protein
MVFGAWMTFVTSYIFIMKIKRASISKLSFRQLSQLGTRFNMSFSSHELIGNKIIGFDGKQRKLLITEKSNIVEDAQIIAIDDIKAISIKKVYNGIFAGALKKKHIANFLNSMVLKFELRNNREPIILQLYESVLNRLYDVTGLERRARNWQLMLSKLIVIPAK